MDKKEKHIIEWLFFIIYIAAMVYFMFFAELLGRDITANYRYNLVPFKEIKRFIVYRRQLGMAAVCANIFGNVAAFIPFGIALPSVSSHRLRFVAVTLYSVALSVAIELIQLTTKVGSCDVDDVILNTLGGIIGYLIYYMAKKLRQKAE